MAKKFKIGDKVVCGDENYAVTYGKIGVVEEISFTGLYYVACDGFHLSYYENELTAATGDELATPEWDGVFRVGDKGATRCGGSYEILATDCTTTHVDEVQPIKASYCYDTSIGDTRMGYFYASGKFCLGTSDCDLMPPTERGPVVDYTTARALDEMFDANISGPSLAEVVAEAQPTTRRNSLWRIAFVYGPMGCGKTRNAHRIASALGLESIEDVEDGPGHDIEDGTLYLTNSTAVRDRWQADNDVLLLSYDQAMHLVELHEKNAATKKVEIPRGAFVMLEHDEVAVPVPANDNKPGVQVFLRNDTVHVFDNAEWRIENGGQVAVTRGGKVVGRYFEGQTYGVKETIG